MNVNRISISEFEDNIKYQLTDGERFYSIYNIEDASVCQRACKWEPNCNHWAYRKSENRCFLKTGEFERQENEDITSGPKECPSTVQNPEACTETRSMVFTKTSETDTDCPIQNMNSSTTIYKIQPLDSYSSSKKLPTHCSSIRFEQSYNMTNHSEYLMQDSFGSVPLKIDCNHANICMKTLLETSILGDSTILKLPNDSIILGYRLNTTVESIKVKTVSIFGGMERNLGKSNPDLPTLLSFPMVTDQGSDLAIDLMGQANEVTIEMLGCNLDSYFMNMPSDRNAIGCYALSSEEKSLLHQVPIKTNEDVFDFCANHCLELGMMFHFISDACECLPMPLSGTLNGTESCKNESITDKHGYKIRKLYRSWTLGCPIIPRKDPKHHNFLVQFDDKFLWGANVTLECESGYKLPSSSKGKPGIDYDVSR